MTRWTTSTSATSFVTATQIKWKFKGSKPGSGVVAHSPDAAIGTTKHYDRYEDEFGRPIEVHYFRLSDGSVEDVKVIGL